MDQAARGASALSSKDFDSAVKHYTDAIAQNPGAVDYYIKRSTAYTRASPPDHEAAFRDSEVALVLANKRAKRELIAQAQLRRAVALSGLERYADAMQCLEWVKKLDDKEKTLAIWDSRIRGKLRGLEEGDERAKISILETPEVEAPAANSSKASTNPAKSTNSTTTTSSNGVSDTPKPSTPAVGPEGVQTPPSKIRHDWMQTNDSVIVSLYCKGIPKDKTTVEIKDSSLEVTFPLPTGSDYHFSLDPLFSTIDRMRSHYKIMSTKAEFTLVKSRPGQKWASIEGSGPVEADANQTPGNDLPQDPVKRAVLADKSRDAGPAYPTSSKSGPKDWDKLASDLSKRPKKDAKEGEEDAMEDAGLEEEEGDPTNNFFKTLYAGADADTKRAMMKSYQESNGTALSTNWAEVGKGPVETSPPDGMVAKKWGE